MSDETKPPLALSRRELFKGAGVLAAAGAASVLGAPDARAFNLLEPAADRAADRAVPSFCEVCFWNCGLIAHAQGNRVLYLSGHPAHPGARGKLCGRGNAGAASVSDPDRLTEPMVRVGARGEGKFEPVGWPMAYRLIAEGFGRIKDKHGARSLALFYHGKGGGFFRSLMAAYGSPNFAAAAYAQCKGPRDVGYKLTFGFPLPSPEPLDLEHTRCMVLFGSHLGENAHNSQVQEFVAARARGAHLIVLDPRLSTAADRASVWLPVAPGSDTAVILAWLRLLVQHGTYHRAFVTNQCTGFEKLAAHVAPFSPAWAAAAAGVPEKDILRAYELLVESMPATVIHPGRHTTWYGEADTQRARAQAILTALLGAMWAPGGQFRFDQPELAPYPGPELPELGAHVDEAAGRFPFAKEVTTNGIREATLTERPYPIKGWLVYATNLLQSMPNRAQTVEAIRKLDFLVVCDVQPTEITRYADVLLPEDTYLERYDELSVGAGTKPYICLRQPVVQSPHETRPGWRIAKELGTELGVGEYFAFDSIEDYLSKRLEGTSVTLDVLKRDGIAFVKPKVTPYLDPTVATEWHTPSHKVELYSQQLKDKGFAPLPVYVPQPLPPQGKFRLLYGRSPLHTFGRTVNNAILFDLDPTNCVWLNPHAAARLGLVHGARVMVHNEAGDETGPLPVKVTERIPEHAVYMVHGFGHRTKQLHHACCAGGSDTDVIRTYAVDPVSGGTGMRVQFVELRAVLPGKEPHPCAMG